MIDILKTKFIKIKEKEFNINEEDFQLIFINAIIIVNDEINETNKNDQS